MYFHFLKGQNLKRKIKNDQDEEDEKENEKLNELFSKDVQRKKNL